MKDIMRIEMKRAVLFAAKVIVVIAVFVTTLAVLRISFEISRWFGFLALGGVIASLYVSAPYWVRWLPGLLIFGVLNSLIALVTHHAPTNRNVEASTGLSILLLLFYSVGVIVARCYGVSRLSASDRCAWTLYLVFMIWPGFTAGSNLGVITPAIAGFTIAGMAVIIASFAVHRMQRAKRNVERV
jgi:hypothetical protein